MNPLGRPITRQIDLNLLELLDTLLKTHNLTETGARLGLSQPAVSYGLAKLRDTYGDVLFIRGRRGVHPTPLAEQLAEPIAQALQLVRSTVEKVPFTPETARHAYRVGMTDIGERYFLPRLSQWLGSHAPGISVEAMSPTLEELGDGLASGDIDLALGFIPGMGKQVCRQPLLSERFVYIMGKHHPAAGDVLDASQMQALRHVVAGPSGTRHLAAIETVLMNPKVRANIVLRVKSFLCVGPIVADTDLVGILPSHLAHLIAPHLGLAVKEPPVQFERLDISMYWNRRFQQDAASCWLRKTVTDLFSESAEA